MPLIPSLHCSHPGGREFANGCVIASTEGVNGIPVGTVDSMALEWDRGSGGSCIVATTILFTFRIGSCSRLATFLTELDIASSISTVNSHINTWNTRYGCNNILPTNTWLLGLIRRIGRLLRRGIGRLPNEREIGCGGDTAQPSDGESRFY